MKSFILRFRNITLYFQLQYSFIKNYYTADLHSFNGTRKLRMNSFKHRFIRKGLNLSIKGPETDLVKVKRKHSR